MIVPHPISLRESVVAFVRGLSPRSRCTNSALVPSLQIVVSHVVRCGKIVQWVSLFVNFWPSSGARLHCRWRVSSEQLHVICSSSSLKYDSRKISKAISVWDVIPTSAIHRRLNFKKIATVWSSDADIARVKAGVPKWVHGCQWELWMRTKRPHERHAASIHRCFPCRRRSQPDFGIPPCPSSNTKLCHDHGCTGREQILSVWIGTGFHFSFSSHGPSGVQFRKHSSSNVHVMT